MSFGKRIFYDWFGANEALFKAINGNGNQLTENVQILISRMSDTDIFPFYFGVFVLCAFLDFGLRKLKGRGGASHCLIAWFGALLVLVAAYSIEGGAVHALKGYFDYPRPYVALGPEDVTLLEYTTDRTEDYRSFPSGHASFITLMVVALWPVLSGGMRKFGLVAVFMVAWARVGVGLHFPADALYAVLLAITVTVLLRWFIYRQLLRFNLNC